MKAINLAVFIAILFFSTCHSSNNPIQNDEYWNRWMYGGNSENKQSENEKERLETLEKAKIMEYEMREIREGLNAENKSNYK